MKIIDLKNKLLEWEKPLCYKYEERTLSGDFTSSCLFNPYGENDIELLKKIIRKAKDFDDFVQLYLNTDEFKNTQAYPQISAKYDDTKHWYRIREMFGDKAFKTTSDAGSVKVGNEHFYTLIPNGNGDGVARVIVLDKNEKWNHNFLKFNTSIGGNDINIYSYDCGDAVAMTLNGNRYGVYSGHGFVVFEKWN